jgi:hypothetical protein
MRPFLVMLLGMMGGTLLGQTEAHARQDGVVITEDPAPAHMAPCPQLPRNFDAVYPRKDLQIDALAARLAPDYLARPWYLTPYRNYAYYRPWYTYGYYGPTWYRYHYAPSWGYRQPWYGPQYLNPDAIAPPAGEQLYHW